MLRCSGRHPGDSALHRRRACRRATARRRAAQAPAAAAELGSHSAPGAAVVRERTCLADTPPGLVASRAAVVTEQGGPVCSRPSDYEPPSRLELGTARGSGASKRQRRALAGATLAAASVVLVQSEAAA
jgi:hypothetical protein